MVVISIFIIQKISKEEYIGIIADIDDYCIIFEEKRPTVWGFSLQKSKDDILDENGNPLNLKVRDTIIGETQKESLRITVDSAPKKLT